MPVAPAAMKSLLDCIRYGGFVPQCCLGAEQLDEELKGRLLLGMRPCIRGRGRPADMRRVRFPSMLVRRIITTVSWLSDSGIDCPIPSTRNANVTLFSGTSCGPPSVPYCDGREHLPEIQWSWHHDADFQAKRPGPAMWDGLGTGLGASDGFGSEAAGAAHFHGFVVFIVPRTAGNPTIRCIEWLT